MSDVPDEAREDYYVTVGDAIVSFCGRVDRDVWQRFFANPEISRRLDEIMRYEQAALGDFVYVRANVRGGCRKTTLRQWIASYLVNMVLPLLNTEIDSGRREDYSAHSECMLGRDEIEAMQNAVEVVKRFVEQELGVSIVHDPGTGRLFVEE